MGGFNVGLELRYWTIADGLGFIPKDDPETFHRNFDPPRRGLLPRYGTPQNIMIFRLYTVYKKHDMMKIGDQTREISNNFAADCKLIKHFLLHSQAFSLTELTEAKIYCIFNDYFE